MQFLRTILLVLSTVSSISFATCSEKTLLGRACAVAGSVEKNHYSIAGAVGAAMVGATAGWFGTGLVTKNKIVRSSSAGVGGAVLGGVVYFLLSKFLPEMGVCQSDKEIDLQNIHTKEQMEDIFNASRQYSEDQIDQEDGSELAHKDNVEAEQGVKFKSVAQQEIQQAKDESVSEIVRVLERMIESRGKTIQGDSDDG